VKIRLVPFQKIVKHLSKCISVFHSLFKHHYCICALRNLSACHNTNCFISVSHKTVGENEAVRIMTGAQIPEGADAVVMFEQTVENTAIAPGLMTCPFFKTISPVFVSSPFSDTFSFSSKGFLIVNVSPFSTVCSNITTAGAGTVSHKTVGENEAVRIMTGAQIPEGADAVVMFESSLLIAKPSYGDLLKRGIS
jgi:hypothetical protein